MFIITMSNNINNGLLTKIWGPPLWESFHSITFGYPIEPDNETKERYRNWLTGLGDVLPCSYCRNSYKCFIQDGDSSLTDNDLLNRDNLCRWGYHMHNRVNNKLGVEYNVTYEELVDKYESYRAKCVSKDNGCTMPINLKSESYKKAEIKHAPVVPYEFCKKFAHYATIRGFVNYVQELDKHNNDLINNNRSVRDKECVKIINYMRKKSIDCTEQDGIYEGLPTLHELALLSKRCSNINTYIKDTIIERLNTFLNK